MAVAVLCSGGSSYFMTTELLHIRSLSIDSNAVKVESDKMKPSIKLRALHVLISFSLSLLWLIDEDN
jgi:hypothetical protein